MHTITSIESLSPLLFLGEPAEASAAMALHMNVKGDKVSTGR